MKNMLRDRKFINWEKTGKKLQLLREDNIELRRFVCRALKHDFAECSADCGDCVYEMDSHISRKELAEVFGVSESVVFNWERGKTPVSLEDILFYAQISEQDLNNLLVFM